MLLAFFPAALVLRHPRQRAAFLLPRSAPSKRREWVHWVDAAGIVL